MNKKKVTMRDIAKEAGFSVATVSRYINKVSYTSPETERKIQQVLDKFDYTPNAIARGLAKQKSNTIAFVTPDITNPFFPEIVKAIENAAKAKGYSLLLINTTERDLLDPDFWNSFKSRYIDGFILAESEISEAARHYLHDIYIPFVRIDRAVYTEEESSVSVNNFKGAQLATRHLLSIGCKKIAHISGPRTIQPSLDRLKGYIEVMEENHYKPIVYEGDFTLEGGKTLTKKLLREHEDIDGVFYANDMMAIGSLKAFKEHRISIPNDIALIGFDGVKLTEIVSPEISTVRQPIDKIGEIATDQLIKKIEKPTEFTDYNVLLDVELLIRESTKK